MARWAYRWLPLLKRTAATVWFPAPDAPGRAVLRLQFLLEGRVLECQLRIHIPN